ncbi:MAG: hypothetical protein LBR33_08480 [Propionibacteriaceae bacterium]|nr:hypothetical protein [Propionibacteriaceae bacterium]
MTDHLVAGAASADITPADLRGLNPFGPDWTSVHDPLRARALVVGEGEAGERVALVALDVVEVGDTTALRDHIEQATGIPADHILLAPSHAHNSPRVGLVPPGGMARVPTPESLAYTALVEDAVVTAVRAAAGRLRPVALGVASEAVDVNVCREAYADGAWGLGYAPDGLSDKTLTCVSLVGEDGAVVAVVMNYAVHSTVLLGLPEASADLAGAACAQAEDLLGPGAVALWTAGSLGDQAPKVEFLSAQAAGLVTGDGGERDRAFAHRALDAQGHLLAVTAVRLARQGQRRCATAPVRGALRVIPCPARRLDVPPGMEQADVDTVDLTLTTLRIGPVAFAGVSGEVTVPVGHAVMAASPLASTLVVTNANARIGYLPADESYLRHTQAADGCPIAHGHAAATIVAGLADLVGATLDGRAA